MSTVADAPLAALAREADPSTVVDFVADLFVARGWGVDRQGERRLFLSNDGRVIRLAVLHPDDAEPARHGHVQGVDRVVVVGEAAGDVDADVVDVSVLGRQLAYAIDREDAVGLLESHFGWSPDGSGADTRGSSTTPLGGEGPSLVNRSGIGAASQSPDAGRRLAVVGILLVAVLLAGGAVALTGGASGPLAGGQADTDEPTDNRSGTVVGVGGATPWEEGTADVSPETGGSTASADPTGNPETDETGADVGVRVIYGEAPPGIEGPNEINIHRVAGAFLQRLDNRSYRLQITYRERVDGRTTGVYTELLRVSSSDRYAVDVSRVGTFRTGPLTIAGTDLYADGNRRYERLNGSAVRVRPTTTYDPFMLNATQYLGWFLSVRNSSVAGQETRGNTTTYHIVTTGDPDPAMLNASGDVYVTGDGLVRYGRWEYTPTADPDVRVVFRMRVSGVGSTEVAAPEWVEDASVERTSA